MMRYNVLVADDEPDQNRDRYTLLLNGLDDSFDWTLAGTREEFERTDFSKYDAVILDINLTGWRHMTLNEAVRTIPRPVPIVFASGRWHDEITIRVIREVLADAKDANFVQILILDELNANTAPLKIRAVREQLRLAIAKARRYTQLSVKDNEPIHILHLSDPQYGDPDTDGWASLAEEQIARFLCDLCPSLHLVAITGDITYQGLPSEFDIARSRIETLLSKVFGKDGRERLLLVPGNHDVNLRLAAADCIDFDFTSGRPVLRDGDWEPTAQRRFALQPFCRFAWDMTGDPRWLDAENKKLCWVNESFRHLGLRFVLLNTVSELDCTSPARATLPLDILRSLVPPPREHDRLFSIALAHHGPVSAPASPEDVAIENWPDTGGFLYTAGVRMFIHGHGHERRVERLGWNGAPSMFGERPANGQLTQMEFLRVMAPTSHLAATSPSGTRKRSDSAARGFNLITLERDQRQVQRVVVQTFTLDKGRPVRSAREEFMV
jgi:CheY-like chemotaxis protein